MIMKKLFLLAIPATLLASCGVTPRERRAAEDALDSLAAIEKEVLAADSTKADSLKTADTLTPDSLKTKN